MITYSLFETESGFGYNIEIDGQVKFYQTHAPAVSGLRDMTKKQAGKLAQMVVGKLKDKPNELPTLSTAEVEGVLSE